MRRPFPRTRKDELNRIGFIRVDFILRDVLTEVLKEHKAGSRVQMCSASDDGMGGRRLRREVGAIFPKNDNSTCIKL